MTSAAVPSPSSERRAPRPRLGPIIGVGVAFAILQTCLIATFPLLDGSAARSRLQGALVTALDFPLGFAQPLVAAVVGWSGGTAFLAGLALTFLNGVLWAAFVMRLRRRRREALREASSLG